LKGIKPEVNNDLYARIYQSNHYTLNGYQLGQRKLSKIVKGEIIEEIKSMVFSQ
jgi:hypothetical protein